MMSATLTRPLLLLTAISSVAACSDGRSDPQGTYHVAITTMALPNDALPATIKWPEAGELTLALDPVGEAKVTFLGAPGLLNWQRHDPDRGFAVSMRAQFSPAFIDMSSCQHAIPGHGYTAFGLYFFEGHVHGDAADTVTCQLSNDIVSVDYRFALDGDRVEQ